MGATTHETVRSRVTRQQSLPDGRTMCRLQIPLGHPAARRTDQDGEEFEIEHHLTYVAGPGSQELRWLDPETGEEQGVGEDLLPAEGDDVVRIGASNLAAYLRRAARVFDVSVRAA